MRILPHRYLRGPPGVDLHFSSALWAADLPTAAHQAVSLTLEDQKVELGRCRPRRGLHLVVQAVVPAAE